MKLKFTLLLMGLTAATAQAQVRKIPATVTEAFKARYPHAEKVAWKDEIASFEAQFTLNGFIMTADFNSKGEWQNSEKKIQFTDLPTVVNDGFKKSKYEDWKIVSVVEIDKNGESLQYRIEVKKSAVQKKYLFFNTNGKLIRDATTI
jgi:hypothetical protein